MSSDAFARAEELETLKSIYPDEFRMVDELSCSFQICLVSQTNDRTLVLDVMLGESYPSAAPPIFQILAPWMDNQYVKDIKDGLLCLYGENSGSPILFQWVEYLQEKLNGSIHGLKNTSTLATVPSPPLSPSFNFSHGDTIVDRKSIFQAHVTSIDIHENIKNALAELKSCNRKVADAYHNMWACRIITEKGNILDDCDDDGEKGAGSRLLHLLNILKITNQLVVVSRWYGGIQLGPDRFKHINNCARSLLDSLGLIEPKH